MVKQGIILATLLLLCMDKATMVMAWQWLELMVMITTRSPLWVRVVCLCTPATLTIGGIWLVNSNLKTLNIKIMADLDFLWLLMATLLLWGHIRLRKLLCSNCWVICTSVLMVMRRKKKKTSHRSVWRIEGAVSCGLFKVPRKITRSGIRNGNMNIS